MIYAGIKHFFLALVIISLSLYVESSAAESGRYKPLKTDKKLEIRTVNTKVKDADREREIPIRIYLPTEENGMPLILFSHGLGGIS